MKAKYNIGTVTDHPGGPHQITMEEGKKIQTRKSISGFFTIFDISVN